MKALVNQANGEGMVSDGHHHFEQPEQELLSGCVTHLRFKLDLTPPTSVYTRANLLSEKHFVIRSILQWRLTFFGMSSHGQMYT